MICLLGGSFPAVTHVRCLFFVAGTVGERDGAKAVAFVKPARGQVFLKAPEFQRLYIGLLGGRQKTTARTPANEVRVAVEQANLFGLPGEEGDDPVAVRCDRDVAFLEDDVGDEPAVFLQRVQFRQKGQQSQRRREDSGNGFGVAWTCRTQRQLFDDALLLHDPTDCSDLLWLARRGVT